MQQQGEHGKTITQTIVVKTAILHMAQGTGRLNGGKNQNPKNSLDFKQNPPKIPGPKFNPAKNPMLNF